MTKCICGHHQNIHTISDGINGKDKFCTIYPCTHEDCCDKDTGKWLCRTYTKVGDSGHCYPIN